MGTANLKLLFICPHGGKEPLDILRKENPSCDDEFIVKREFNTRELTESIYQNIQPMIEQIPHMVMVSYHRKYVDFNREEPCAFEQSSILAKEKYRAYHNDISLKINEIFSQIRKVWHFYFIFMVLTMRLMRESLLM